MRKQDRIAQTREKNRTDRDAERGHEPQPQREQARGSATTEQQPKPQRQPGKLPLPD